MGDPVSTALIIGSTALSAVGQIQQGKSQQKLMNYQAQQAENIADAQAKQLEYRAGQERASTQRKVIQENRTKNLALSRAQALVASSGGGSLDPSVINLMGDLETQGEYNKSVINYEGEESAKGNEYSAALTRSQGQSQAAVDRFSGKMYKQAGYMAAASTVLKGGSSMYDKYAGGIGGAGVSGQDGTFINASYGPQPKINWNSR